MANKYPNPGVRTAVVTTLPIGSEQIIEKGAKPDEVPAGTTFPQEGDPRFWDLLFQWIVIELRFGINWLTVLPALLAGYSAFDANLVSHNVAAIIMAALIGLNAFARTTQSVSNMAKAAARANGVNGIINANDYI